MRISDWSSDVCSSDLLSRPVYRLTVAPGEREAVDIAASGSAGVRPRYYRDPQAKTSPAAPAAKAAPQSPAVPKRVAPEVKPIADLEWPAIERARLSHGIEVVFARRSTVPTVRLWMSFDAGHAADDKAKPATHAWVVALLDDGPKTPRPID